MTTNEIFSELIRSIYNENVDVRIVQRQQYLIDLLSQRFMEITKTIDAGISHPYTTKEQQFILKGLKKVVEEIHNGNACTEVSTNGEIRKMNKKKKGDAEYIENCGTIIINEKEETTIIVKGGNKNGK